MDCGESGNVLDVKIMSEIYLFLDDIREVKDVTWVKLPERNDWKIVRSYDEFVNFIQKKWGSRICKLGP